MVGNGHSLATLTTASMEVDPTTLKVTPRANGAAGLQHLAVHRAASVRDLGLGESGAAKMADLSKLAQTPLPVLYCPTAPPCNLLPALHSELLRSPGQY